MRNDREVHVTTVLCPGADPFQSVALPETVEDVLEDFVARCIAFNRWGTLLAGEGLTPLATRLPMQSPPSLVPGAR